MEYLILFGVFTARSHAAGALVEHVTDQLRAGELGAIDGRLDDGNSVVTKHKVAQFMGERAVPGR